MRIWIFVFLLLVPLPAWAEPIIFLKPDLHKQPKVLSSGTKAQPWCVNPKAKDCLWQWSQQAVPMAVYSSESSQIPSYQFFLPILIPSKSSNTKSEGLEHWRPYLFSKGWSDKASNEKSSSKKRETRYYINALNHSEVRIVSHGTQGAKTVKTGKVLFVSLENIDIIDFSRGTRKPGSKSSHSNKNSVESLLTDLLFPLQNRLFSLQNTFWPLAFATNRKEAFAFNARVGNSKGCFTAGSKTQADFCFECPGHPVLSKETQNTEFLDGIADFLNKSRVKAQKKITSAVPKIKDEEGEGDFTRICMSDNPLGYLISTFNHPDSQCPIEFEEFYPAAYCESCKRSIPPELMLALMSIESSAKCQAEASTELENSLGLFQINVTVHGCTDRSGIKHPKNTDGAKECLRNPINNLIKSVGELAKNYESVNPKQRSTKGCQPWSSMEPEEKDRWRKATASYNSGAGWLIRAIKSVKIDYTSIEKDGDYYTKMTGTHDGSKFDKAKQEYITDKKLDPSWEEMRHYFFTEKLLQNPSLRLSEAEVKAMKEVEREEDLSGRQLVLTLSNVAYVESILGRNEDQSYPGMVDIWEQYIKNNKPKCN